MRSKRIDRRDFVRGAATVGAGLMVLPTDRILGANDRINMAVIGTGGRGSGHVRSFHGKKNVAVVAVSDADEKRMARSVSKIKGDTVAQHQDLRKVLDMKDVDAVCIATPNHWHAPCAILACQAGKHVYVEKPVSHCIWEGRKMVEAAKKYKRIVQGGTQQRSCPAPNACGADLRAGTYGKIKWVHCMKLNLRGSIGKVDKPQKVPDEVDYNLWAGPAPMTPVMRKRFHYDWHWQWNWGDGEMGNWCVHYLDDLVNMLDWTEAPTSTVCAGGRFVWDDNGQTPNVQFALMEHKGMNVVAEIRDIRIAKDKKGPGVYMGSRGGNMIMCEDALIKISRGGGKAYTPDGKKKIKDYKGNGGRGHRRNFIDCIRSGKSEDLNTPIESGHLSTLVCHMNNIAWRIGKTASIDQVKAAMKDHEDALNTIESVVKQISANDGDLGKMALGPQLTFDPKTEQFTGENAAAANEYLRYEMRKEFAVPDRI